MTPQYSSLGFRKESKTYLKMEKEKRNFNKIEKLFILVMSIKGIPEFWTRFGAAPLSIAFSG